MVRVSRPCYDKPWRCPGWAGGGMRYARRSRCNGGHMRGWQPDDGAHPAWRFHRCDTCDVLTWPYITRWLDWRWLAGWASMMWETRTYR